MRQLTPKTQLATLRTEAKRWLKAFRDGDTQANARLKAAWPKAPDAPVLRDIQHALALEYGQAGWQALSETLAQNLLAALGEQDLADQLLQHAWNGDLAMARRVLERRPEAARINLATAIVTGDLAEVRRRLAANPAQAREKTGPHQWEPLLYLCYAHLPLPAFAELSLEIARALLEAGADPKAEFNDGWDNSFTCLTGVIGQGEGVRPTHPRAVEMAELLIAAGADPFDGQALYNTSIVADDVLWNDLLWRHCEARGTLGRWRDLPNPSIGGNIPLSVVDYLLGNAVIFGHIRRATWLVERGANPNGVNAYSRRAHHANAQVLGRTQMAEHLVSLGAMPVVLDGLEGFQAAAMALDEARAREIAGRMPMVLQSPHALMQAAEANRADVIRLLLDLGVPPMAATPDGAHAFIRAGHAGALEAAKVLIEAGADPDQRGGPYNASGFGGAVHFRQTALIDYLAPFSRDIPALTRAGKLERIVAVLEAEPERLKVRLRGGRGALFSLPDDEDLAAELAELLLAYGADPLAPDDKGITALDEARKRGLEGAADLMAAAVDRSGKRG